MPRRTLGTDTQARLQHVVECLGGAAPSRVEPRTEDRLVATLEFALLSPAYGGGDQPGEREPSRLFRVPSIRGQLRFWWRAARAGAFGPVEIPHRGKLTALEHMRLVEGRIWGMTSVTRGAEADAAPAMASCVRLRAEALNVGAVREQLVTSEKVPLQSGRGYVYFPARATSREGVARPYWWGPTMRLTIEADLKRAAVALRTAMGGGGEWSPARVRHELTAALWAWTTFGGYGARTRRGAGALGVVSVEHDELLRKALSGRARDAAELSRSVLDAARQFVSPASNDDDLPECPLLHDGNLAVIPVDERPGAALSAEERAVEAAGELLRRFRQDRFRPQGRSRWPEPNALRLILKRSDPTHVPPPDAPQFFPRAALGLPIVFHFKSEADPSCELIGQSTDRLASPLVLRPHRLANGKLALVVLVLNTLWEPPGGLALRYGKQTTPLPAEAGPLDGARFAAAVGPLSERRSDDALSAFLRHVGGMAGAVLKRIGS